MSVDPITIFLEEHSEDLSPEQLKKLRKLLHILGPPKTLAQAKALIDQVLGEESEERQPQAS
jgi:hypothetical protein